MFLSGAYRKGFTLLPVHHCMFSLLHFPAALLQLRLTLQDSAWPQLKHRNEKELSKPEEGAEYLYLLCFICLGTSSFHLIQSSNKGSQCLVPYTQAAAGCCARSESWHSVINDYRSCML